MSIATNKSRVAYTGNGAGKEFAFDFAVWDPEQVRVLAADAEGKERDLTGEATITLSATGGTVTLNEALPSGHRLVILRAMPFVQEDRYLTGTRFDPHEIEDALDVACAERQELRESLARAVKMPATDARTPEEYQAGYFTALETLKADAVGTVEGLVSAGKADMAQKQEAATQAATEAGVSKEAAEAALRQVQEAVRGSLATAVQQCLDAAEKTGADRAAIDAVVQEASEKAAACIIARCTGAADLCLQYATSAAASSCAASMTHDSIWAIIREYAIDAGEEAAQCVLSRCETAASTAEGKAQEAEASATAACACAENAAKTVQDTASETVERLTQEFTNCMESVCVDSVDLCLEYSKAAAASAVSSAETVECAQALIKEYAEKAAQEAAKAAAEATANCCQEICAECVELAATHAAAASASASSAAANADRAAQTDVCKEMTARRGADEALGERIAALEARIETLEKLQA